MNLLMITNRLFLSQTKVVTFAALSAYIIQRWGQRPVGVACIPMHKVDVGSIEVELIAKECDYIFAHASEFTDDCPPSQLYGAEWF